MGMGFVRILVGKWCLGHWNCMGNTNKQTTNKQTNKKLKKQKKKTMRNGNENGIWDENGKDGKNGTQVNGLEITNTKQKQTVKQTENKDKQKWDLCNWKWETKTKQTNKQTIMNKIMGFLKNQTGKMGSGSLGLGTTNEQTSRQQQKTYNNNNQKMGM